VIRDSQRFSANAHNAGAGG